MNETYTFSRALHLMRYGGKKMRPIGEDFYLYVNDDERLVIFKNGYGLILALLDQAEIMGSWEEVK